MSGFKNKEELLNLLLNDTQRVIEETVKEIAEGEAIDTLRIKTDLENLYNRIENYRSLHHIK